MFDRLNDYYADPRTIMCETCHYVRRLVDDLDELDDMAVRLRKVDRHVCQSPAELVDQVRLDAMALADVLPDQLVRPDATVDDPGPVEHWKLDGLRDAMASGTLAAMHHGDVILLESAHTQGDQRWETIVMGAYWGSRRARR